MNIMSTNDIYDVSAELEKEFGAKGTKIAAAMGMTVELRPL